MTRTTTLLEIQGFLHYKRQVQARTWDIVSEGPKKEREETSLTVRQKCIRETREEIGMLCQFELGSDFGLQQQRILLRVLPWKLMKHDG